jgi:hypothetical protein
VCCTKDSGAWGLVASTRLDTNKAIFDDIDAANTVFATQSIQGEKNFYGTRDSPFIVSLDGEAFGKAAFEDDDNDIGSVWGLLKALRELPHIVWRSDTGIFQDASFIRDVEEVLICGPWLGSGLLNRDVLLGSILQKSRSPGESVVESL